MTGTEIRARRRAVGLAQVELAALVGVGRRTVCRWERGEVRPRERSERALAHHLGLPAPMMRACPMRPSGCACRCHGPHALAEAEAAVANRSRTA